MAMFSIPAKCERCKKKTKQIVVFSIYPLYKEKTTKKGKTTTINIPYLSQYSLCIMCVGEFHKWLENK